MAILKFNSMQPLTAKLQTWSVNILSLSSALLYTVNETEITALLAYYNPFPFIFWRNIWSISIQFSNLICPYRAGKNINVGKSFKT